MEIYFNIPILIWIIVPLAFAGVFTFCTDSVTDVQISIVFWVIFAWTLAEGTGLS